MELVLILISWIDPKESLVHEFNFTKNTLHKRSNDGVVSLHVTNLLISTRWPRLEVYEEPLHQTREILADELRISREIRGSSMDVGPDLLNRSRCDVDIAS